MYKKQYKKKNYKKQNCSNKEATWGQVAKKALSTANYVRKLVNAEFKYYDVNIAPLATTYSGSGSVLCVPSQGITVNQREGDSIKMKNCTLRGMFQINGTTQEVVRLIVIMDKQNLISAGSDLLQYTGNANVVWSPKNANNKYDCKVLLDKTYNITSNSPIKHFDEVIKVDEHCHFDATTTTVSNNSLKLFYFSQQVANGAFISYYTRTSYLDN